MPKIKDVGFIIKDKIPQFYPTSNFTPFQTLATIVEHD